VLTGKYGKNFIVEYLLLVRGGHSSLNRFERGVWRLVSGYTGALTGSW